MQHSKKIAVILLGISLLFVASAKAHAAEEISIAAVLDTFHAAASRADGQTYFSLFAPDGVFIGTDATERWTVPEFKAYAKDSFDAGKGWTYVPQSRHITVERAEAPRVAWFDELLKNEDFGLTRGTGVLMKIEGEWRIEQYSLSLPIPNDAIYQIGKEIKSADQANKKTP
ncbi:MAG: nuclear transport factor 2 family protein [Rhodospirillaceae bacterium]